MIVQNFSKWTTTQEISKMLMEIQGTETQKRVNILGQEYIFWVLGGQWLCTTICNAARVVLFLVKLSGPKSSVIMISAAKIGSWKQVCVLKERRTVTVKQPTLSKVRNFFSLPNHPTPFWTNQFPIYIPRQQQREQFLQWETR